MQIHGIWYTETEAAAYIAELESRIEANARPVRCGRWRFEHGSMICSACEYEYSDDMVEMCMEAEDDDAFDFCPHCGVRMEVQDDE